MARVVTAIVLAAIAAALAVWLAFAGGNYMSSLERSDPPIAHAREAERGAPLAPAGTPRLARRVYLVILDGLGRDRSKLPFLDSLRARGLDVSATTHYPTWSRPNYISILSSVWPLASGVRTNYHPLSVPLDSIAARARAAGLRVAWVSDYPVIPPMYLMQDKPRTPDARVDLDDLEIPRAGDVETPPPGLVWPYDDVRREPSLDDIGRVAPTLDADLVVIVAGDIDRQGHAHGGASAEYREAAEHVDRMLAQGLARVDLARDTIIVTADHGHVDAGGHGGLEDDVTHVPLILVGAGIRHAPQLDPDARLVDIAPTIAALLGIAAPQQALGFTLTDLIELSPEQAKLRTDGDAARAARLQQLLAADARALDDERRDLRSTELPIAVGGLGVSLVLVALLARRGIVVVRARSLPLAVTTLVLVVAGFVAMVHARWSPSEVPPRDSLIHRAIAIVVVAVVIQLVATWRGLRAVPPADRVATHAGLVALGVLAAIAPIALVLANAPQVDVPGPAGLVAIPGLELAAAAACAAAALGLVVRLAFAAFARATR